MRALLTGLIVLMLAAGAAQAGQNPCPRPAAGSTVERPKDLTAKNGVLAVKLNYYTAMDDGGHVLFCYVTDKGFEAPTLRVNPGDTIKLSLTNMVPPIAGPTSVMSNKDETCGSADMTPAAVNLHFHGTNTTPKCHGDDIIRTLINPGETFQYKLTIPEDEPPGLYWYHHHVHSLSESALLGGASGLIEIMGIEALQPAVTGLPQRMLIVRDQPLSSPPGAAARGSQPPSYDLSLNYVPVPFPDYPPAVIKAEAGSDEFWRIANGSADSIIDIQLQYDGKPQQLRIVGLDGIPTGSQDGTRQGTIITAKDVMLPPGARAEFIATMPSASVSKAELITKKVDTGVFGDNSPERPLAAIEASAAPADLPRMPKPAGPAGKQRFEHLADVAPTAARLLYFSEGGPWFFITVDGQTPRLFDPNNPPAIVTTEGAVEDWTIENRAKDEHIFHIHQIHFLLEDVNGVAVPKKQQQLYDTYPVQAWSGTGDFPSITVRMDFRGPIAGDFVYHCHILGHEDAGMMAIIRVKKAKT